jgi:hypothetical protein
MSQGNILWIGLLIVLAVAFLVVLRRVSGLIRRTRDLERFQRNSGSLGARLAATTGPLVRELDALRRHAGDPEAVSAMLAGARAVLDGLAAEGRTLQPPRGLETMAAAMASELARAVRAAEMVRYGLEALADTRGAREIEAQTSLKRGALNLRHASETFSHLVRQAKAIRPADLADRAASSAPAAVAAPGPYGADDLDVP